MDPRHPKTRPQTQPQNTPKLAPSTPKRSPRPKNPKTPKPLLVQPRGVFGVPQWLLGSSCPFQGPPAHFGVPLPLLGSPLPILGSPLHILGSPLPFWVPPPLLGSPLPILGPPAHFGSPPAHFGVPPAHFGSPLLILGPPAHLGEPLPFWVPPPLLGSPPPILGSPLLILGPPAHFGVPPPILGSPLPFWGPPCPFWGPPSHFGSPPSHFGVPPPILGSPLPFWVPPLPFWVPPAHFGVPPPILGPPCSFWVPLPILGSPPSHFGVPPAHFGVPPPLGPHLAAGVLRAARGRGAAPPRVAASGATSHCFRCRLSLLPVPPPSASGAASHWFRRRVSLLPAARLAGSAGPRERRRERRRHVVPVRAELAVPAAAGGLRHLGHRGRALLPGGADRGVHGDHPESDQIPDLVLVGRARGAAAVRAFPGAARGLGALGQPGVRGAAAELPLRAARRARLAALLPSGRAQSLPGLPIFLRGILPFFRGPGLLHLLPLADPLRLLRVAVGRGERPALHRAGRRRRRLQLFHQGETREALRDSPDFLLPQGSHPAQQAENVLKFRNFGQFWGISRRFPPPGRKIPNFCLLQPGIRWEFRDLDTPGGADHVWGFSC